MIPCARTMRTTPSVSRQGSETSLPPLRLSRGSHLMPWVSLPTCRTAFSATSIPILCARMTTNSLFSPSSPIALAPGMGLNAYFSYTVVGYHGSGAVPYRVALTAIFVEGFIYFALALFGMRQWLARAIPRSIKQTTKVSNKHNLTLIGLTYSEGSGLVGGGT